MGGRPPPDSRRSAPRDRGRNVLLVSAFEQPADFLFYNGVSLGLLAVEASLRNAMRDVGTVIQLWQDLPSEGGRLAAFERLLRRIRPAIVGISSYSAFMPLSYAIAAAVRRFDPAIPVILGGAHATAFPHGVGANDAFDYHVAGEGVRVAPLLVGGLFDGGCRPERIPSLAFRQGGRVVTTPPETPPPDMDGDPAVAWERLDFEAYRQSDVTLLGDRGLQLRFVHGKLFPYETGRGCRHRCAFCERVGKTGRRTRSPERVVGDLLAIRAAGGIDRFFFTDDLIQADAGHFRALLDRLERRVGGRYYMAVRADELDRQTLDRMAGAGVGVVHCFPESGSARIRRRMGKPLAIDRLLENMDYASRLGMAVCATFIIGWPGETLAEAERTCDLAASGPFDLINFNPLYYFGAARVGRHLSAAGILPGSPEHFRVLRDPFRLCLAGYSPAVYRELVNREHAINRRRLADPGTLGRLSSIGIEVERPVSSGPAPDRSPAGG